MCFEFDALPPDLPADRVVPSIRGGAAAEILNLRAADGATFSAAFAQCPEPSESAVIILPDVRGHYRFYIELAERFSEAGHHAIAIDYFGRTAGTGERSQDFDFMSNLAEASPAVIQRDIAAARELVAERTRSQSFVTVGFCFGGANSFLAGTVPALGLRAAVGFYGTLDSSRTGMETMPSPIETAEETKVPIPGLFGGSDELIPPEDIARFEQKLSTAGVTHELITYPGAPHSFFDRAATEFARSRRTLGGECSTF